jgi:RNA polymerase sigma-70 factor (ECF subfamily)
MFQKKPNSMRDENVPSDAELIRKIVHGQVDAFTLLYERHLPSVYNRVRYRIPESDVEDVTQEVFITALRSLKSFKGNAQFSTWLRTLTNRRVADFYRSKDVSETQSEPLQVEGFRGKGLQGTGDRLRMEQLTVASKSSVSDDKIVLREALLQLPEHYQEILLLRFAEGLKFREIAKAMGQSLEATKSLYRRAMDALREIVGDMNV